MAGFLIEFTDDAKLDLAWFKVHERKSIIAGVKEQLAHEPEVRTRNRKPIQEEPPPRWELRIGRYRAFYEVARDAGIVLVGAVGYKEHNVLYIRGQEVKL